MNEKLLVVRKLNSNFFRIYYSHNMPITHITHESLSKDLFSVIQKNWNYYTSLVLPKGSKFDSSKFSKYINHPLIFEYNAYDDHAEILFIFKYDLSKVDLKLCESVPVEYFNRSSITRQDNEFPDYALFLSYKLYTLKTKYDEYVKLRNILIEQIRNNIEIADIRIPKSDDLPKCIVCRKNLCLSKLDQRFDKPKTFYCFGCYYNAEEVIEPIEVYTNYYNYLTRVITKCDIKFNKIISFLISPLPIKYCQTR